MKKILTNRRLELASKVDNARKVVENELLEFKDQSILSTTLGSGHLQIIVQKSI